MRKNLVPDQIVRASYFKEETTIKPLNELMKLFPNNQTILEAVLKTEDHIASGVPISVSVSGGVTLTLS